MWITGGRTPRGQPITSYASALVGMLAGIAHVAIGPVVSVAGVKPTLALVAVVLVAALAGVHSAGTVAFAAGVGIALFGGEPLGVAAVGLLTVAALSGLAAAMAGPVGPLWIPAAAFAGSLAHDGVALGLLGALGIGPPAGRFEVLVGAAALNAVLTLALFVPARAVAGRLRRERLA